MPLSLGAPNKVSVSKSGSLVRLAGHEAPVALRAPPHSLPDKEELRKQASYALSAIASPATVDQLNIRSTN